LPDPIEEAALLLRSQGEDFGDVGGFLVALGVFQAVHGGSQGFLGGRFVGAFLLDHFPVHFPPVLGVFGVEHFARAVADVALDQFLPERAGVLGDLGAGDFDVAELLRVVDSAEDGLDGVVGQVRDVVYAHDVADGGVLGHGHQRGGWHGVCCAVLCCVELFNLFVASKRTETAVRWQQIDQVATKRTLILSFVNKGGVVELRMVCWKTKR